jgi:hypothetical protein
MMPGIPNLRKESHPERAQDERRPIYSRLCVTKCEEDGKKGRRGRARCGKKEGLGDITPKPSSKF